MPIGVWYWFIIPPFVIGGNCLVIWPRICSYKRGFDLYCFVNVSIGVWYWFVIPPFVIGGYCLVLWPCICTYKRRFDFYYPAQFPSILGVKYEFLGINHSDFITWHQHSLPDSGQDCYHFRDECFNKYALCFAAEYLTLSSICHFPHFIHRYVVQLTLIVWNTRYNHKRPAFAQRFNFYYPAQFPSIVQPDLQRGKKCRMGLGWNAFENTQSGSKK